MLDFNLLSLDTIKLLLKLPFSCENTKILAYIHTLLWVLFLNVAKICKL